MRALACFLGLLSACATRAPRGPQLVADIAPANRCLMYHSTGPLVFQSADTTATHIAFQDFNRETGTPDALLYIAFTSGRPDRDQCVRVRQRGPHRFKAYSYRAGRVDSLTFDDNTLPGLLASVPAAHFSPVCPYWSTVTQTNLLWVKHGSLTSFSMDVDLSAWQQLYPVDQALLQPGINILTLLKQTKGLRL
jgi:hypothetical protein